MIIEAPEARYECISHVLHTDVNDSYICKKSQSPDKKQYVLNVVHNRDIAKRFLIALQKTENTSDCISYFTWEQSFCIVLPYSESRSITRFFMPETISTKECNEILKNIVLACMTAQVPYPLLYLVLKQKKLNLSEDYGISVDYCIDMSGFDESVGEEECLRQCLSFILILSDDKGTDDYAAYQVLSKRYMRGSYSSFLELYRDIDSSDLVLKKDTIFKKLKRTWGLYGRRLWLVVKMVLFVIGIVAIILFVCEFLFGDVPFMRIFINSFKVIGDRNLAK
jgi:hypothetical protein